MLIFFPFFRQMFFFYLLLGVALAMLEVQYMILRRCYNPKMGTLFVCLFMCLKPKGRFYEIILRKNILFCCFVSYLSHLDVFSCNFSFLFLTQQRIVTNTVIFVTLIRLFPLLNDACVKIISSSKVFQWCIECAS